MADKHQSYTPGILVILGVSIFSLLCVEIVYLQLQCDELKEELDLLKVKYIMYSTINFGSF